MGAAAAPAALIGIGANAFAGYEKGLGQQSADDYQADVLSQKAQIGRTAAVEENAALTTRLSSTLANIDAVRAAGHDDPSSPMAGSLRATTYTQGNQERAIRVGNILQQSESDQASADYLHSAGSFALEQGILSGIAGAAGTVGSTNWSKLGLG